jgi:hypothetical protein
MMGPIWHQVFILFLRFTKGLALPKVWRGMISSLPLSQVIPSLAPLGASPSQQPKLELVQLSSPPL